MSYAEVAVNSPGSRSTFCYAIPSWLDLNVGQAVWVPFGPRVVQGIIVELSQQPSVETTKEIIDGITDYPLLSSVQIELARWISEHYLSPLFDAIALMLPPGFERQSITYFRLESSETDLPPLTPDERQVLDAIGKREKTRLKELERKFGASKARRITGQLLNYHLITRNQELERPKVKAKIIHYVKVIAGKEAIEAELSRLGRSRAHTQAELLGFLNRQSRPISVSEVTRYLGCSVEVIRALERRQLISVEPVHVRRDPMSHLSFTPTSPPVFTLSQQAAWKSMENEWNHGSPPVFLLFGVTGSGKTELYLRALAKVIATGRQSICLVPEISLTAQTVERFASRFHGRVAVLHSSLSLGEQFDEWQWIKEGNCDVVIGPRSALFAPLPNLGLIIIDEEHEWTYKQEDKSPRYHARDVAIKLARLSNAVVIMGSATPDIGTFYKTQLGQYQLVELRERITPHGYSPLPKVNIIDMKQELKAGNTSLFSRSLFALMKETLRRNEQIILFLNRRGTATFVQCRNCGFVFRCPHCSIALTYHSVEGKLTCHRCHYSIPIPQACPQCFNRYLRFSGIGTQRIEDEVKRLFPDAKLLRWDRDATAKRHAHEELLTTFREHKADVLVGTQMIAKGLDIPQVTLAGIISADSGLNFPDFRAGERTFQLLCQVAGRAGRGVKTGRVIIQTYCPDNYAIQSAAKHDYVGFYDQEIEYRRQFDYPPFSRFARLAYTHINDELCRREAERVSQAILHEKKRTGITNLSLIGPVPAFAARVRGRYRWQIILRGGDLAHVLSCMTLPQGWTVDVDPVGIV